MNNSSSFDENHYNEHNTENNTENNTEKYHLIKNILKTLTIIVTVFALDMALGLVYNTISPIPTVVGEERLEASGVVGENLENIQKDSEKLYIDLTNFNENDPNSANLYSLTEIETPNVTFSQQTGRKTFGSDESDYTIAVIGGSSPKYLKY